MVEASRCLARGERGAPCPHPAVEGGLCPLHARAAADPPPPSGSAPATPPASGWSRRDFLGGVLRRRKEDGATMLRESGLAGAFGAIRDFVRGYRKLTRAVEESLEAKLLFDDRASELPRDMEQRGEFWLREAAEADAGGAFDPTRLPEDLGSEDPAVREAARAAAIRHGDPSLLPLLAPLLESERPATRSAVLEILGSWRDVRTLPLLARRLEVDPDPGARVRAVLALKELEDERTVEPLLAATEDQAKAVRVWAGAALRERLPGLTRAELKERVEAALSRLSAAPGPGRGAPGESPGPGGRGRGGGDQEGGVL